jgi:hypothetical protein
MLTDKFPNTAWNASLKALSHQDILSLRRVSKTSRTKTDDIFISKRQLKTFVKSSESAKYLITMLNVPNHHREKIDIGAFEEISRPDYPKPGKWKISVMTVVSFLSTPVDLRSVFHCLDAVDFLNPTIEQIENFECSREETGCKDFTHPKTCMETECECLSAFFPGILDVHFEEFCRGDPTFAEVKAKKRGKPSARTFNNQCTMRICFNHYESTRKKQKNGQKWNIVNLKMFQNGKIQMTGCETIEQAKSAVQFLIEKIMEKAPTMRHKLNCMTQMRCFSIGTHDSREILREIRQSKVTTEKTAESFVPFSNLSIWKLILLHVPNESLFACRPVCKRLNQIVESESFWVEKCNREIRCICAKDNQKGWYLTQKFNGRFNRMEPVRKPEYFCHPRLLYCRHRALRRFRPFIVAEEYEKLFVAGEQIGMINSDFKTNFELNLPTLYKILKREYKLQVDYSPDGYAAVNVKYVSPIMPDTVNVELQSFDLDDNKATVISFFVFRTGSIIINSARSIEQQNDAYQFINSILKKHYDRIWLSPSQVQ